MEILFYKNVQIEQGSYISWFSGEMFSGDQIYDRNFTLSEIPLFVQAGSIIPLKTEDIGNNCIKYFTYVHGIRLCSKNIDPLGSAQVIPTVLKLMVFVGDVSS